MNSTLKLIIYTSVVSASVFSACENTEYLYEAQLFEKTGLPILEILQENENMSIMCDLLEKASIDALMNTYGQYTVFAPSDSAFNVYFETKGIAGIEELNTDEIAALVDFHVIINLINVKTKNTGVLGYADTTMSGIRHFVDLSNGFDNITINKNSLITKTFEASNGIVYIIDNVLEPHPDNVYDYLQASGKYSIFTSAIDIAGFKDTLQQIKLPAPFTDLIGYYIYPYFTIFAEPDAIYNANGIYTSDDLKNTVWSTNYSNAGNIDQALNDFVRYHILSGQRTIFNLYKDENLTTMGANNTGIVHIDASPDIRKPTPVLNSVLQEGGTVTGGLLLNFNNSDVSCINGLVHELENGILFFNINYRQTKIINECEDGLSYILTSDGWLFSSEVMKMGGRGYLSYLTSNPQFYSSTDNAVITAIGFTPVERGDWVEFTIRNVVPGNYNVFINYLRDITSASEDVNVYFRSAEEEFSWETQLINPTIPFDMAQTALTTGGRPSYRQNYKLGIVVVNTYGDYIFRFAHVDIAYGIYDNIILEPVL